MVDSNFDAWRFWLDVFQWLFIVLLAAWGLIERGRKDNKIAIEVIATQVETLEHRVITAEEQLRHLPTHEDIADLRSKSSALGSKLDRVTNTLDRIHDYLMNNK